MIGNCKDCEYWQFEDNRNLQSESERQGFGVCGSIEATKANPLRAMARLDDELCRLETRQEYGCIMFQAK